MVSAFNFRQFDPFFVGFDRMWNEMDRLQQSVGFTQKQGYPPYNIVKHDDEKYTIELAVAGFGEGDINVDVAEDVLTIKGKVPSVEDGPETIHKGIAGRNFERKFTLADTIVCNGATLENGMLKVELERIIPEEKKPRLIPINGKKPELLNE